MREARLRLPADRRNADPESYDPATAGFLGFGDQSGSKQGTLKTYLEDAHAAGARFVVNCRADRIFCEHGRAAGVEGTYIGPDGRTESVVVRAPHVVAAGGSLETPALLLRSRHRRAGRRATTCACTRPPR